MMNKQEFDKAYGAFRLYRKLNDTDYDDLYLSVIRVLEEKRQECWRTFSPTGSLTLYMDFISMRDERDIRFDRYLDAAWVTRMYQKRYGIHSEADWGKIQQMKSYLTAYRKNHKNHVEYDNIPF